LKEGDTKVIIESEINEAEPQIVKQPNINRLDKETNDNLHKAMYDFGMDSDLKDEACTDILLAHASIELMEHVSDLEDDCKHYEIELRHSQTLNTLYGVAILVLLLVILMGQL
jgi:hypothetical protein